MIIIMKLRCLLFLEQLAVTTSINSEDFLSRHSRMRGDDSIGYVAV
jgi:hypothetical protein